nr:DUF898 family protein [uncultured Sphingomonas sp.]
MNIQMVGVAEPDYFQSNDEIAFSGRWAEYLKIVSVNFVLTIVTIGLYRFWAKARERRYLWSRTEMIGEPFEWEGTGKELFIGFLVALPLVLPTFAMFGWGIPRIASSVGWQWAVGVSILTYLLFFTLLAFARFRALRYRLSRSRWRGISGGATERGYGYALRALGRYAAAFATLGVLYPWCHVANWNDRWGSMGFGSSPFTSRMTTRPLRIIWAVTLAALWFGNMMLIILQDPNVIMFGPGAPALMVPLLIYAVTGICYLAYLSAFYRSALDELRLGDVEFTLDSNLNDWLNFYLATAALTVVTLGLAIFVYQYRRWKFIVDRLEIHGGGEFLALRQSQHVGTYGADGLADAFDIGAF